MKEFLFRKNLWTLDFITSIIFAIGFGYCINYISDNTEDSEKADLIVGILAYILTFALALGAQKRYGKLPSWAWLGVFGALLRIVILMLLHLPQLVQYELKYSPSFSIAVRDIFHDLFMGITFNWIVWGILCLLCIFTVRIVAYIFRSLYLQFEKYES